MKTDTIHVKENNPRKISDEALNKLAKSIQRDPEFMVLRPIVVDRNKTIIGGNQRYRAITEILDMKDIPDGWVKLAEDLTDEQLNRFVLMDNFQMGEWDVDLLSEQYTVNELQTLGFNPND